ncbi:hypothetical protein [Nostoc sp. NIES-3756]|jgi:hypothetical protein|uniref:hypothetical protein n=1 Tax=Nostoc sp. NIES-3756 TaxID=1751286 RepID=UPI0014953B4B|nr:hypothetical protein [Nostoc sp. NIES-3756]
MYSGWKIKELGVMKMAIAKVKWLFARTYTLNQKNLLRMVKGQQSRQFYTIDY